MGLVFGGADEVAGDEGLQQSMAKHLKEQLVELQDYALTEQMEMQRIKAQT